jgi:pimeloyl-ACP methyl ester carboxylesterase
MSQRIQYLTDDGVTIVGSWVTSPTTVGAALLLHAHPNTKESWGAMQLILSKRGIASLAIDLRGHGESIHASENRILDYRAFTDEETLSSMNDLRGGYEWIRGRGIDREAIALLGASIGANLALQLLAELPTCPAAVLLSPGMNYHGVTIEDAAENVCTQQGVWMAASAEDDDESVEAASFLDQHLIVDQKVYKKLRRAGHGTMMLEGDAVLSGSIADWVRDRILSFDIQA